MQRRSLRAAVAASGRSVVVHGAARPLGLFRSLSTAPFPTTVAGKSQAVANPGLPPTTIPARTAKKPRQQGDVKSKRLAMRAQYIESRRTKKGSGSLGSTPDPNAYHPDALLKKPPTPSDVTLELLMANQTHMGHSTSLWNPANSRYILGVRQGIHIISLEETASHLRRAARVVEEITYRAGLILFVGTRPGHSQIIARASDLAGACRLWSKWIPGSITNAGMLLKASRAKVVDEHDKPIEGYERYLEDAPHLVPDLVIVLNPLENGPLLHECSLVNVPTIGIIDTDADPTKVTYTIPANDDSLRSIAVISLVLGRAGEAGRERRLRDAAQGKIAWKTKFRLAQIMQEDEKSKSEAPVGENEVIELRRALAEEVAESSVSAVPELPAVAEPEGLASLSAMVNGGPEGVTESVEQTPIVALTMESQTDSNALKGEPSLPITPTLEAHAEQVVSKQDLKTEAKATGASDSAPTAPPTARNLYAKEQAKQPGEVVGELPTSELPPNETLTTVPPQSPGKGTKSILKQVTKEEPARRTGERKKPEQVEGTEDLIMIQTQLASQLAQAEEHHQELAGVLSSIKSQPLRNDEVNTLPKDKTGGD